MLRYLLTFFLVAIYAINALAQTLELWYNKSATRWEESVPLGNGQVGMMPNGGVQDESIVLNEISLWSGSYQDANNYEAYKSVEPIQQLLFDGKNDEAQDLVNKNFVCVGEGSGRGNGANVPFGCFQNFGFLNFNHQINGVVSNYKRTLNLNNAIASTSFEADGVHYLREYFTSQHKNVGVVRLSADQVKKITFAMHFYRDEHVKTHYIKGDQEVVVSGILPDGKGNDGMSFAARIRIVAKGGSSQTYDNQIIVKNADEVLIYVALSTDFYDHNPDKFVFSMLKNAKRWNYDRLKTNHIKSYQKVFNRVSLVIKDSVDKSFRPTDQRLYDFYQYPEQDNGLVSLYYHYGRYLSISSTAPKNKKALPPNLQGLWAHQIQTPWNGDYHLNINAQMNHWGVEVGNLSEYHQPFINLIQRVAREGEKTAKAYYSAPGWVTYMITNIWNYSAPGEDAAWGSSTASGWLCNHLWEHYVFTQDKKYLAQIFPVLKGAAEFYQATLVKDPKTGWLVTSPSVSPENGFRLANGKRVAVVMGPTIDNQIVRELYTAVIKSDSILRSGDPFARRLKEDLGKLPPPVVISKSGRVMEWLEDYEEVEIDHRHVSHLYGLYPANFISPVSTPEWAEAAKQTLNVRGDEGTGWSRAWKILFWARLHDGDRALDILRQLLKPAFKDDKDLVGSAGTYPNLFCAHPPFQIDGNFGGSAGIAEMLLQSQDGYIHLLPALPKAWVSGEIKGLKARGNYTVDIAWEDHQVTYYRISGKKGKVVKVFVNSEMLEVRI